MSASGKDGRLLVMHVVFSFAVGGLENGVVNLINRLDVRRFRHVVVALTKCDPVFCARVSRPDVEFVALHKPPGHSIRLFPALFRLFRKYRPDVVHTRNLAALETTLPAWLAGVPVRIHGEHGWDVTDPDGTNRTYRLIRRLHRPFVTHYIALSGHLESYLRDAIGVPGGRVTRICNGVDLERFVPRGLQRAAIAGSPFNDPKFYVFGTVGRLQEVKDQMNLLRAFVLLIRCQPELAALARLILVGEGPLRKVLEAEISRERVDGHVWLAGERGDVPNVMSGFDCFVLPSKAEGISNTILEAMAAGLPVVATAVGGSGELVENGVTGVLVPPQDADSLAGALQPYLIRRELAAEQGRAGRKRVETFFSIDGMVGQYAGLYQSLSGLSN
ncbi:TIGR03088 family PEP-CTERM/XrtA system glycosyltransferase [Zoogloea sp.]|mgnify:CR=1 FL=1|jgi:sugar transferase (PEP-CTERM/EpsH1 system associated)|uniref:TIGR03088 family PEP-CTERM/XrtA system glycosyltransferase n=2 Tax=Zoogloea sp. TaxID=49181 RepID=UPI0025F5D0AF|nr:TIGR03088 family PEP-CTERM/XrtA system glycosyltransferase [Zoogloea sp.]HOY00327.1 TIGR03088 family PEP-CTERM/XrtA system glycosyltransferase [Zoogloea sp.]